VDFPRPDDRLEHHLIGVGKVAFNTVYESLGEDPLVIRGIAITQGKWNGLYYPSEVLKKVSNSKRKLPILVEHARTAKFLDSPVGYVRTWKYDDTIKGIIFDAVISDEGVKELIKGGKLPGVSISAYVETRPENSHEVVTDLVMRELSLVKNPACHVSLIAFNRRNGNVKLGGGDRMSEQELSEIEYLEDLERDEVEEAKKRKRGYPYYPYPYPYPGYGYPYPYPYPYYYGYPGRKGRYPYPYGYPRKKLSEEEEELLMSFLAEIEEELQKTFKCPACGKEFNTWRDFFIHWQKEHAEEYGVYKKKEESSELKTLSERIEALEKKLGL